MTGRPNHVALVRFPGGELRSLDEAELGQIDKLREKPGCLIWLDITDPADEDIGLLRKEFDVHPLAVEDLQLRKQRPKVDTYPGQHVIVTYEVRRAGDEEATSADGDGPALGEIHLFVGQATWTPFTGDRQRPSATSVNASRNARTRWERRWGACSTRCSMKWSTAISRSWTT